MIGLQVRRRDGKDDCLALMLSMIDFAWLNRLGIVLNFFAGFMLAPELIGLERLTRAEIFLESKLDKSVKRLNSQRQWLVDFMFFLKPSKQSHYLDSNFFDDLISCSGGLFWFFIFIAIIAVYFQINILKQVASWLMYIIGWGFLIVFGGAIVFTLGRIIIWILIILTLVIVQSILRFLLHKLKGDERLQAIIVWWGVIFFILGNLFQFVGSF